MSFWDFESINIETAFRRNRQGAKLTARDATFSPNAFDVSAGGRRLSYHVQLSITNNAHQTSNFNSVSYAGHISLSNCKPCQNGPLIPTLKQKIVMADAFKKAFDYWRSHDIKIVGSLMMITRMGSESVAGMVVEARKPRTHMYGCNLSANAMFEARIICHKPQVDGVQFSGIHHSLVCMLYDLELEIWYWIIEHSAYRNTRAANLLQANTINASSELSFKSRIGLWNCTSLL